MMRMMKKKTKTSDFLIFDIQGNSRVIMSSTELKMQRTLHFQKKLAIEIKISRFFQF
jgi:hypothetical protein